MFRTISLVLALSFIGAVAAIEVRAAMKSVSCEPTRSLIEASLPLSSQRPMPRPVAFAAAAAVDRQLAKPVPLVEWVETIDLDLRHSLSF